MFQEILHRIWFLSPEYDGFTIGMITGTITYIGMETFLMGLMFKIVVPCTVALMSGMLGELGKKIFSNYINKRK